MTQITCSQCGTANNTSDMGYCWKCKSSLAPVSGSAAMLRETEQVLAEPVTSETVGFAPTTLRAHPFALLRHVSEPHRPVSLCHTTALLPIEISPDQQSKCKPPNSD